MEFYYSPIFTVFSQSSRRYCVTNKRGFGVERVIPRCLKLCRSCLINDLPRTEAAGFGKCVKFVTTADAVGTGWVGYLAVHSFYEWATFCYCKFSFLLIFFLADRIASIQICNESLSVALEDQASVQDLLWTRWPLLDIKTQIAGAYSAACAYSVEEDCAIFLWLFFGFSKSLILTICVYIVWASLSNGHR